MTLAISGTTGITLAGQFDSASTFGFKNRIINGGMVIDQRNAGAASTAPATGFGYLVDRWYYSSSQASKFTAQQNQGSVTPPVGFSSYQGLTSSSAYSVTATDYFILAQYIEGFNTADLAWGTANATSVTLSFKVYSSLTGTFGGVFSNSANSRSYPFTYTISSANTWTSISVTIAGDTTGTWIGATNGIGLKVIFGLGVGSTYSGTAGSWSANTYLSATGSVSVVGTNGATFYITGVQLEKGSTATSFDFRPFGTEFMLCQRYFEQSVPYGTVAANGSTTTSLASNSQALFPIVIWGVTAASRPTTRYMVPKRATPTVAQYGNSLGYLVFLTTGTTAPGAASTYTSSLNLNLQAVDANQFSCNNQASTDPAWAVGGAWQFSAEL
jgi:hypothetical protein